MQGVETRFLAILAAVAVVVVLAIDKATDPGFAALDCLAFAFVAYAVRAGTDFAMVEAVGRPAPVLM